MSEETRLPHPNALPHYDNVLISAEKLTKYALNPWHVTKVWGTSSGSDKARVFKRALGFDLTNWEVLRNRLIDELPFHEAVLGHEDEYGQRYNVTLPILGVNGKTTNVLTAWIIAPGTDRPALTTIYCV